MLVPEKAASHCNSRCVLYSGGVVVVHPSLSYSVRVLVIVGAFFASPCYRLVLVVGEMCVLLVLFGRSPSLALLGGSLRGSERFCFLYRKLRIVVRYTSLVVLVVGSPGMVLVWVALGGILGLFFVHLIYMHRNNLRMLS